MKVYEKFEKEKGLSPWEKFGILMGYKKGFALQQLIKRLINKLQKILDHLGLELDVKPKYSPEEIENIMNKRGYTIPTKNMNENS